MNIPINHDFIINSERSKKVNELYLNEKIGIGHIILLTEIVVRKMRKEKLPNVKWLQTELQISFTKLKSIIELLEERKQIVKINDPDDQRGKLFDITEKGLLYIQKMTNSLPL